MKTQDITRERWDKIHLQGPRPPFSEAASFYLLLIPSVAELCKSHRVDTYIRLQPQFRKISQDEAKSV